MKKEEKTLIENFKKLENQMIETLKSVDLNFDEKSAAGEVKKGLKASILKVRKLQKLFDEYESTAKELEKLSSKDKDSHELADAVVDMREPLPETKIEIENINGNVKVKTKKNTASVKEF